MERGRAAADTQVLVPALAFQCRVAWELGPEGIGDFIDELVDACHRGPLQVAHEWFSELAVPLAALGRLQELEAVAASVPTPTPWRVAGLALGGGDPLAAAKIFAELGARPFEADARLLAAKGGLQADLTAAIAFFREVGASVYLAEAEALVAKTRSA